MADPITAGAVIAGSYVLGKVIAGALSEDPDQPVSDEKPTTLSSRGAYVNYLIGRDRLAPFFAWAGNRYVIEEDDSSGGKGASGASGTVKQLTYFEDGVHIVCVGPAYALHRLWINGDLWEPDEPITPATHPEGSSIDVFIDDDEGESVDRGTMQIFWGFPDGTVDGEFSASSRMGVASSFPYCFRIHWRDLRLGGFAQWPLIEYDTEVRPFRPGYVKGTTWGSVSPHFEGGSAAWLNGFFGPAGTELDIVKFDNSGSTTTVSVEGNKALQFSEALSENERVTIAGSDTGSNNGVFRVTGVRWEPTVDVEGPGAETINSGIDDDLDTWTPSSTAGTPVDTGGYSPPSVDAPIGDDVWSLDLDVGETGGYSYTDTSGTVGYSSRLEVFVHQQTFDNHSTGSHYFALSLVGTNTHQVRFQESGGTVSVVNESNGAVGSVVYYSPNWWLLSVSYTAGAGTSPSASTDSLTAAIFNNAYEALGSGFFAIVYTPRVYTRPALSITGVTEIDLDEDLADASPFDGGTIEAWKAGFGPQGPNPAHALYQMMFAEFPHGAGLSEDDFYLYGTEAPATGRYRALKSLGILAATEETLNSHITIKNGDTLQSAISNFLIDMGWMLSWDVDIGRFVFVPIRDPNDPMLVGGASIPVLNEHIIVDSFPSTEVQLVGNSTKRQSFTYRDSLRNFRNDSVVAASDGSVTDDPSQRRENTELFIARDRDTAEKIAARRAQEEINKPSGFEIICNHEARRLYPGLPLKISGLEDFDEEDVLRLMAVKPDPYSSRTTLTAIFDNYSLRTNSITSNLELVNNGYGSQVVAGTNDLALALVELPAALSWTSEAFTVLRIRANRRIANADIHISRSGVTYNALSRQSFYCGGGTLLEPWADSEGDETEGPVFRALGEDTLQLAKTLTTEDFQNGRQVVYMGGEWFFVKSLEAGPDNTFQLKDFHRAKFGSSAVSHATGDTLFLFNPTRAPKYRDVLAQAGQTLIIKSAPKATTRVDLADASTATRMFTGVAGPVKNVKHSGDETDLAATYPAASYAGSTVLLQESVGSNWVQYYSDGTSWNLVN